MMNYQTPLVSTGKTDLHQLAYASSMDFDLVYNTTDCPDAGAGTVSMKEGVANGVCYGSEPTHFPATVKVTCKGEGEFTVTFDDAKCISNDCNVDNPGDEFLCDVLGHASSDMPDTCIVTHFIGGGKDECDQPT